MIHGDVTAAALEAGLGEEAPRVHAGAGGRRTSRDDGPADVGRR